MASSRVRNSQELPAPDRPAFVQRHHFARNVRPIPIEGARLIYFDRYHSAELLEHIASSKLGYAVLAKLAEDDTMDLVSQRNQRVILSRLIARAEDLKADGIIDLHQSDGDSRRISWIDAHPDQPVAVKGRVSSEKDVEPSSLRLEAGGESVRALVRRDHFLHLNQAYLMAWSITIVGKVRSVPDNEILTVAIGITPP